MFRPIGSLPPATYWRRRLLAIGAIGLAVLTVYVLFIAGGGHKKQAGNPPPSSAGRTSAKPSPDVVPCVPSVLSVAAKTSAKRYEVGERPELEIQVKNTGERRCIANLSDSQIELVVYNGASRVWGSHDCKIQPGDSPVTLAAGKSVRRSIRWSGLSSEPHCAGHRLRVGKGTYTLHARFDHMRGTTTTFTFD